MNPLATSIPAEQGALYDLISFKIKRSVQTLYIMKKFSIIINILLFSIATASANSNANPASLFKAKDSCFIVVEVKSGKIISKFGQLCDERLYANSTFKVPLVLMALDADVLKNKDQILKWDGTKQLIKSWEQDHNAKTWLKDSVVWFSQRLTPQIGLEKIKNYLKDFKYGNQDFSGGIGHAWLSSTLKISPQEQIEFLRRLKNHQLKIKSEVLDTVLSLIPTEVEKTNFKVSGKTGSGFSWSDSESKSNPPYRLGWYIGYLLKNSKDYAFVAAFKGATEKGKFDYAGREAKEFALRELGSIEIQDSSKLNITLAHNDKSELQGKKIIEEMMSRYDLTRDIFTKEIIIESKAIPHSHPVLTLNTRTISDPHMYLATFIHEQMHWYFDAQNEKTKKFIALMKIKFPEVPKQFAGGAKDDDSTYLHLGVCYYEFMEIERVLGKKEARRIFEKSDIYTWVRQQVLDKSEVILNGLEITDLMWKPGTILAN